MMTPQEFKTRYLEGLKEGFKYAPDEVRAKLEEKFSEFLTFPLGVLERSSLPQADKDFLSQVGLPKSAAPALNFQNLYEIRPDFETRVFFEDYFFIGLASRQRLIVIDKESADVACLDLSGEVPEVMFVNDSLEKFAECLCLFQEYRERNELDACLEAMRHVDARLNDYYSFWEEETQNFFDNVRDNLNEAARKANP